ncbi:hypothetical protein WJX73_006575 [Symbiochloris irregularis]|uniref:Allantoate amidohydrolase n=1 Tax=Symbiochloris irregularis TaxID=706552 RepID=A0AAW1PJ28_9CHLO
MGTVSFLVQNSLIAGVLSVVFVGVACPASCNRGPAATEAATLKFLLDDQPNRHLQKLGEISDGKPSLVRTFASPAHGRSALQIQQWMEDAGMRTWIDSVANVHGRIDGKAKTAPVLVVGSHYDTVMDAGKYDGALGIIVGIAAVKALLVQAAAGKGLLSAEELADIRAGRSLRQVLGNEVRHLLREPVEVVAWSDEEGLRFQSTFLGSRAVAGSLLEQGALEMTDAQGHSLADVLSSQGFNSTPASIEKIAMEPSSVKGYVEVHMEQGPVLQDRGAALAPVAAIAGQSRLALALHGTQGHAGTVPMHLRHDPFAGAVEVAHWLEQRCLVSAESSQWSDVRGEDNLVCTVGSVNLWPGASNVIPGSVNMSVDVRSQSDALRKRVLQDLESNVNATCDRRGLDCMAELKHDQPAVACDGDMIEQLQQACIQSSMELPALNYEPIVSGAGHDALAMAAITKIGMLFVRCLDGISHSPLEYVEPEDVATASGALYMYLRSQTL